MGTHPIFESDFDCLTDWVKTTANATVIVARLVGDGARGTRKQTTFRRGEGTSWAWATFRPCWWETAWCWASDWSIWDVPAQAILSTFHFNIHYRSHFAALLCSLSTKLTKFYQAVFRTWSFWKRGTHSNIRRCQLLGQAKFISYRENKRIPNKLTCFSLKL